jgi:hypothetical protein
VAARGAIELLDGVFRPAKRLSRTTGVGMRAKVDVAVAQQRQDRVIERRRRDLDLAAFGRRSVLRYHLLEQLQLDLAQDQLVAFGKAAPFGEQAADPVIAIQIEGIDPRQLVPDLQVPQIAR